MEYRTDLNQYSESVEIDTRKCAGNCGYITRHPIRWCPNCGTELKIGKTVEKEFYRLRLKFREDTGWEWAKSKFNYSTGEPL